MRPVYFCCSLHCNHLLSFLCCLTAIHPYSNLSWNPFPQIPHKYNQKSSIILQWCSKGIQRGSMCSTCMPKELCWRHHWCQSTQKQKAANTATQGTVGEIYYQHAAHLLQSWNQERMREESSRQMFPAEAPRSHYCFILLRVLHPLPGRSGVN